MPLAALVRQQRLALPLGIAGALLLVAIGVAGGAAYPLLIERRCSVRLAHGHAAGMAERVGTGLEAVGQADALIEHETFALPQALLRRHCFQIFEDAAFELEHLLQPLRLEEG